MRIHSLHLENFMLHVNFKRIFEDKDIIGLVGDNRSGKSTILEAFKYVLHGTSRAERETELIHYGADKMMVTLVLIDEGRKITIERGRDRKNNGRVEIRGIEKKGEVQATIDELIGYNKDELDLTCFFNQMDINQFMELKPAAKKTHLMAWLKNTHWTILERAVLEDIKEANKKLISIKAKLGVLKEDDADPKEIKAEVLSLVEQLSVKGKKKRKLEKWLSTAQANRELLEGLMEQWEEKREAKANLSEAQRRLDTLKWRIAEYKKETKGLDDGKLRDKKAKLSNEIEALDKKISGAEDAMTGTCPVLDEPCDRIECDTNQVKKWERARSKVYVLRAFAVNKIGFLEDQQHAVEGGRRQQVKVDRAKAQVSGMKALEARIKVLEGMVGAAASNSASTIVDKVRCLQEDMNGLSEKIGGLKAKVERSTKSKTRVKKLEQKVVDIQAKISRLRYLAFMFGKNGIPSQEIENAFDEIEDEMNFVLDRLGTKVQVEFKPDRELGTWEDYCAQCGWQYPKGTRTKTCEECDADRLKKRKDELQLRVLENGVDAGFYMESGGGKTMVSLAVRLSLTRLKQRQTGSRFNVLFLDEPDASLDTKNKKAFVRLITTTLIKEFAFEQIFWISHSPEITESIPHVLQTRVCNGVSKTRWVS